MISLIIETYGHIVKEEIFPNHIPVNFAQQKELFVMFDYCS